MKTIILVLSMLWAVIECIWFCLLDVVEIIFDVKLTSHSAYYSSKNNKQQREES